MQFNTQFSQTKKINKKNNLIKIQNIKDFVNLTIPRI